METLMKYIKEATWFVIGWVVGFIMAGVASANGWLTGF